MSTQRNILAILTACAFSGCADTQTTGAASIAKTVSPRASLPATPDEDRHDWCGKRLTDWQSGKPPGGAKTLEQKQADDRVCATLKNSS